MYVCMTQGTLVPYGNHVTTDCLVDMGFVQGVASPCCFEHKEWKVSVVVHGDDLTALGTSEGLTKYDEGTKNTFGCNMKGRLGDKMA